MNSLNPAITTSITLLIYERQESLNPKYLTLVPTIDSELDFYYVPYLNVEHDQDIETAVYEYCKEIGMYLWSYSIQTHSVSVSRYENETKLTRNMCIVVSVEDISNTHEFSLKYDGDNVNAFSLTDLHEKLTRSPYYGDDLRKTIALLKLTQRNPS